MRRRRRDERHQADAATGRSSGRHEAPRPRVERGTGQATWRGSGVRPGQLVHQVPADAGDRVRPAIDVELAPDRRHAPGADVADLVGVATRLAPGPQGRAEAEVVLQALVVEEVGVARRRGTAGVGAPLSGHDRHATERHGVVAGPLERVGRDRPPGEAAGVDVRCVDEVAVGAECRWNAAAAVRPHDRRLEEQQVTVSAGRALGPPDRLQGSAVEVRQCLHLLRAERVRLVHHVVARDRRRTGEATRDVAHHARVAGADADTARAGDVVPERLEGGAHGWAQLADTAGHASWGVAVEGGPTGCPIPAQRTREARWADLAATGRERGPPGILVEVDDGVDPVPGEQAHVGRDLVEIGLVVVAGPRLDAGPGHQQPGAVPADAGHAFRVLRGEREGGGKGRAPPVVDVGVDVDAPEQDLTAQRVDDAAAPDGVRLRVQRREVRPPDRTRRHRLRRKRDRPRHQAEQAHGPSESPHRAIVVATDGRLNCAAANGGSFPPDLNRDHEPHLVPRRRAERPVPRVLPGERRRDRAQRRDADVVDGDHRGLPTGLHADVRRDRRVLGSRAGRFGHDGRPVRRVPLLQPVVRPVLRRPDSRRAGLRRRPADVRGWRGAAVPARARETGARSPRCGPLGGRRAPSGGAASISTPTGPRSRRGRRRSRTASERRRDRRPGEGVRAEDGRAAAGAARGGLRRGDPRVVGRAHGEAVPNGTSPALLLKAMSGIGGIETSRPAIDMWRLGRMVAGSASLSAAFAAGVDGLEQRLREAGAPTPRSPASSTASTRSWPGTATGGRTRSSSRRRPGRPTRSWCWRSSNGCACRPSRPTPRLRVDVSPPSGPRPASACVGPWRPRSVRSCPASSGAAARGTAGREQAKGTIVIGISAIEAPSASGRRSSRARPGISPTGRSSSWRPSTSSHGSSPIPHPSRPPWRSAERGTRTSTPARRRSRSSRQLPDPATWPGRDRPSAQNPERAAAWASGCPPAWAAAGLASSPTPPTPAASNRARCSSRRSPTPRGPRCSSPPPRSSSTWARSRATPRSSLGSSASPRW